VAVVFKREKKSAGAQKGAMSVEGARVPHSRRTRGEGSPRRGRASGSEPVGLRAATAAICAQPGNSPSGPQGARP